MYDRISCLIFLILLIKPALRMNIKNYYTFRYLNYLEAVPKLFKTDIINLFCFFYRKPGIKLEQVFYFLEPVPEPRPINSKGSSPRVLYTVALNRFPFDVAAVAFRFTEPIMTIFFLYFPLH